MRILIAEDNAVNLTLLRVMLNAKDIETLEAADDPISQPRPAAALSAGPGRSQQRSSSRAASSWATSSPRRAISGS